AGSEKFEVAIESIRRHLGDGGLAGQSLARQGLAGQSLARQGLTGWRRSRSRGGSWVFSTAEAASGNFAAGDSAAAGQRARASRPRSEYHHPILNPGIELRVYDRQNSVHRRRVAHYCVDEICPAAQEPGGVADFRRNFFG